LLGAKSDGGWAVVGLDQGFELLLVTEGGDAELPPSLIKRLNGFVDFSAGDGIGGIEIAGAGTGLAGAGAGGGDRIKLAGGGGATRGFGGGGATLGVALGVALGVTGAVTTGGSGIRGVGVILPSFKDFAFSKRPFLALSLSSAWFSAALAFSSASLFGDGIKGIAIVGAGTGLAGAGAGGGDRIELAGGGGAARGFGGGGATLGAALGITGAVTTGGSGIRGAGVILPSFKDFAFSKRSFLALSLSSACFSAALAFSSASFFSC
jgi:hypothetical protein